MAIYKLEEHTPEVHPTAWVAESADVVGRVSLGENASIWYGAVVRADNDWIRIGKNTNVQDNSVLHTDTGVALTLGDNVTVGHQVMLHGCTVGDNTLVGIQSVVLNGATIGKNCLVGAGSLITEGKSFPDGVLIVGRPAKVVRELTADEIARLSFSGQHYVEQQQRHAARRERIDG